MTDSREPRWWDRWRVPAEPDPDAPEHVPAESITDSVPRGVRIAAAWSWRLIVIGAALTVGVLLVVELRFIIIPLLIAVLLSALLLPLIDLLTRHHWPRGLAVAAAMLAAVGVVTGLFWLAIWQISQQAGMVRDHTVESIEQFKSFLLTSPIHLTDADLNGLLSDAWDSIQSDTSGILSGALSVGSTFGHLAAGILLALFSLLFILLDGRSIWTWILRFVPKAARHPLDGAGLAGWNTLRNYARTQILVASIDAIGIGLGAFLLGVPLAIPIAVLVFLGSFVPIVGAVVTGALAVFVALVYNGPLIAVIMLGVVLLVQQVEGHVLQPLLMGTAVKVHPLAVVLVVAGGSMVAGIPGALFAVPIAAVMNVMVGYILTRAWENPDGTYQGNVLWRTVPAQRAHKNEAPGSEPAPAQDDD